MLLLAMDKSNRYIDADGRLHVRVSHLTKATVSPYRGAEIPGYEELGLDADKVYRLLRDPAELEKGAATWNNAPLLDRHVPVSVDEHMPDLVVGSTGTDAVFNAPYLDNSLVVWAAAAIAGIESNQQREISSAYRYVADMTPGTYEGLTYDGVMRNLVCNHVALVEVGRAGPDVIVGDSQPTGAKAMLRSRTALLLKGALSVYLKPRLAQDAKLDLNAICADVTAANFAARKAALVTTLTNACAGKLAADAELEDVMSLLDAVGAGGLAEGEEDMIPEGAEERADGSETSIEEPPAVDDGDIMSKVMAFLEGKLSPEDMSALTQLCAPGAADEPPPFEGSPTLPNDQPGTTDMISKPAMDAALAQTRADATKDTMMRLRAVSQAETDVQPFVGKLEPFAMDSAEAVYKFALDSLGIDIKGVHPSALRAILLAQPKPGVAPTSVVLAADAKIANDLGKQFPGVARIRRA